MTPKQMLDKWYSDFCKENGRAPMLNELLAKAKELGCEKI